jgi:O-antigen/teichoic acid export membrane protein
MPECADASVRLPRAREALIVIACQAGAAVAMIAIVKILTRYFEPAAFGIVAVLNTYVTMAITVIAAPLAGFGAMNLHEMLHAGRARTFLGTLFFASAGMAVIVLLLASVSPVRALIGAVLPLPSLVGIGMLFLAIEMMKVPGMAIAGASRWRRLYGGLQVVDGWGRIAMILLVAQVAVPTVFLVIAAYSINDFVVAAVLWFLLYRAIPPPTTRRLWSVDIARRTITEGAPFTGLAIGNYLLNSSDRAILAALVPAHDVGMYVSGYQTAAMVPIGLSLLLTAFFQPVLLQWHVQSPEQARVLLGRTVAFALWLLAPTAVLLVIHREPLLRLATSDNYASAAGVIAWVGPALCLSALSTVMQIALFVSKRTATLFRIGLAVGTLNIALNLVFVPRLGYMAAAISTFVSFLIHAVLVAGAGRRFVRWEIDLRGLAGVAGGVAVLVFVELVLHDRVHWSGALFTAVLGYSLTTIGVYLAIDEEFRATVSSLLTSARGRPE